MRVYHRAGLDPFKAVDPDLRPLSDSLKDLVGIDHPVLNKVARHLFEMQGKRFRPTVILLMAQASGTHRQDPVFAKQKRLAEVIEMIHTASLIHDDVIDIADSRRGTKTVHKMFGNKVAVLAGDFLLARASLLLARLRNTDAMELVATILEDMVHGEMMQARAEPEDLLTFDHYILKNYMKTGSLISLSCQAAAVLGGAEMESDTALACRNFGRHLGVAYQLIDDMLDFTASEELLGKPALADMRQGLATAPALFAAQMYPEMDELIKRQFSQESDLEVRSRVRAVCSAPGAHRPPSQAAYDFVQRSDGISQSRRLAEAHAQRAIEALGALHGSPDALCALTHLCHDVINRQA